ncbi:hypothetical protein [Aureliella helgolandensis]|uniref:Uncharacterized protein n=1 Tax=Aureliella helgolandensis TaxID=2527968 RepID=A0A518G428_9BACT|nr:hypothetical protein [Aureliella helgolandensis]QDV23356.1 hypothetical protein Q31a_16540 [Aureliella helgolandensis]
MARSSNTPIPNTARQPLSLFDLFVLLSATAIAFSFGAPFLRELNATQWYWVTTLAAFQVGALCLAFCCLKFLRKAKMVQRQQLLAVSGSLIGKLEDESENIPGVKKSSRWFEFVHLIALQALLVATTVVGAKIDLPNFLVVYSLVPYLLFTVGFIAHWVGVDWLTMGGQIQFFEAGMSIDGVTLIPWDQVSIRPRKLQSSGIAIVYSDRRGLKNTVFADCSDALRQQLLERPT